VADFLATTRYYFNFKKNKIGLFYFAFVGLRHAMIDSNKYILENAIERTFEAILANNIYPHLGWSSSKLRQELIMFLLIVRHLLPMEHTKQGHPDAETLKYAGCPIYKELCMIFSEPATNGKHDLLAEHDEGTTPSIPCADPLSMHQEESSSDSDEVDDIVDDHNTTQPTTPCTTGNRKRGRRGIDDAIAGAIMEMAASSKLRTAAIQQCNARYTIADCINELDEMQGVDEQVYFAALDLFNKPNAREIFLSLKGDKRLIWLRGKCATYPAP
jgi:hypothetical protein